MKRFLLYGHGGAYNHGAEAIVRSTVTLLKKDFPDCEIVLSTHFKEQDVEFNLPVDHYCERDMEYVALDKQSEVKGKYDHLIYKSTLDYITPDTVCLSIGGDNYCYDNWRKWKVIHETALAKGAFSVLWSCSIEPSMLNAEMIEVLKTHHLITARECLTYQALQNKGLNNVQICSDVAFLLEPTLCKLPEYLIPGNTVAINISPLVMRREKLSGIVLENVRSVVEVILTQTDMNIIFIPHVLMSMDNDLELMRTFYQTLPKQNRVSIVDANLTAAEYKYIISKCRFGILARTHASIAAYSSFVPTMVLGYSVKSSGIATDLGLSEFVLPIQEIETTISILTMFQKLLEHEDEIHEKLVQRIPKYKELALVSLKSIYILVCINS